MSPSGPFALNLSTQSRTICGPTPPFSAAVARLAAGEPVERMRDYRAGTMFVRISLDQITTLERFEALATHGEWKPAGDDHVPAPL